MKIMVVDDEQDVQYLFKQKFRKELKSGKLEMHFEFSGETALEYIEKQSFSNSFLILSDINMPGMNGLELLKKIKEKFSHIKVYMITAYIDEYNYQTAMDHGADDYLTKPIDFDTLRSKLLAVN
jgi:CheY-like chemotaxis protein